MEQMDISTTSSEASTNESLNRIETAQLTKNDVEEIITNDINSSINSSTVESRSNDSMEGKRIICNQRRSSLLNTKSFLMNSMLHFQDREKIVAQLAKKKSLEPKCRNFFHGRLYNYVLPAPKVTESNQVSVRLYGDTKKFRIMHFLNIPPQLLDRQDVVMDKVLYLSTLLRASRMTVLYTGPGLSAACQGRTNARPGPGHAVLASLVNTGLAAAWVQTCPDGLAQKAGCPQEKVLEVAGSWFDPCNPVLRKTGTMRPELKVIGMDASVFV